MTLSAHRGGYSFQSALGWVGLAASASAAAAEPLCAPLTLSAERADLTERPVVVAASDVDRANILRRHSAQAALALLMACVLTACSPVEGTRADPAEPTVSVLEAIQTSGEFGLPVWPEILGVESDSGADIRYRMAMRLDDGQLEEFLSQFLLGPQPSDMPKSMSLIAGPALESAPDPQYLQNGIDSTNGAFVREIIIDKRAPDETYVHISVYTL